MSYISATEQVDVLGDCAFQLNAGPFKTKSPNIDTERAVVLVAMAQVSQESVHSYEHVTVMVAGD